MLFSYRATTKDAKHETGTIEAQNVDLAISSLQRRGLIILSIEPEGGRRLSRRVPFLNKVRLRDVVILSRQIATLFEAKVSVLSTFRLLATEAEQPLLQEALTAMTDDIKAGVAISSAMARHPEIFSEFYVSMVRSGEESGRLSETFNYLADYLDRSYELLSRARNALIYPIFVIITFFVVMILMVMFVIPKLSAILAETGQEMPIYTRVIVGTSNFLVGYGWFLLGLLVVAGIFGWRYVATTGGRLSFDRFKISLPYLGRLYRKLYLSRLADNLNTLVTSGISMVRALEITAEVVENRVYRALILQAATDVKTGRSVSDAFARYDEIPSIMIQMVKVGEETGKIGFVLDTLAKFYRREVNNEVDTLVGLIEPAMIVVLGLGVGLLLTSVLVPIYNIASGI